MVPLYAIAGHYHTCLGRLPRFPAHYGAIDPVRRGRGVFPVFRSGSPRIELDDVVISFLYHLFFISGTGVSADTGGAVESKKLTKIGIFRHSLALPALNRGPPRGAEHRDAVGLFMFEHAFKSVSRC